MFATSTTVDPPLHHISPRARITGRITEPYKHDIHCEIIRPKTSDSLVQTNGPTNPRQLGTEEGSELVTADTTTLLLRP